MDPGVVDSGSTGEVFLTSPSLSLLLVTAGLTLLIKLVMSSRTPANIPPFPDAPYPILGHMPYFKGDPRAIHKRWREKTGEIYSLYIGPKLFVFINSYNLMKEAFVKQADVFSNRPVLGHVENANEGLIFANGPLWKEQRTVSLNILRSFGFGKSSMQARVDEEMSYYLDAIAEHKGKPMDVRPLTTLSLANVICSIIVGRRFEYSDALFQSFIEAFKTLMEAGGAITPATVWPWLIYIPGNFLHSKDLDRSIKYIMDEFSDTFIKISENDPEGCADSFVSSYLKQARDLEKQGKSTTLNRRHLRRDVMQLFVAGAETTGSSLLWMMVYLLRHPEIQDKMYAEIEANVGTSRAPDLTDKAKLPYTMAVIKETQRLGSVLPDSVPHAITTEAKLAGYTIPAGTTVVGNLDAVLHDPNIWGDPLNFRPERFLDDHGKLINKEEFIPFSVGRRMCLGESLARTELYMYTTALVQKFQLLKADDGKPLPTTSCPGATSPPTAFQLRLVERAAR